MTFGSITLPFSQGGLTLAKYDASGSVVWANATGPLGNDMVFVYVNDVAVAPGTNQLYVVGAWSDVPFNFNGQTIAAPPAYDGFVFSVDATDGALGWFKQLTTTGVTDAFSVKIGPTSQPYVCGGFGPTCKHVMGGVCVRHNQSFVPASELISPHAHNIRTNHKAWSTNSR